MPALPRRLKEARQRAGLSQEKLGIEAGLDPMSASARMNRYELGKRVPDAELVERIAEVLKAPVAYFYATDDEEADLLLKLHSLSEQDRAKVLAFVSGLTS
ncbi:helix-turn-helix domain-containing protein [Paraburkholderia caledonica]|uniref:Transcriptional regulator with XRE-family HTH domain n=1 Tax=Paraburkholderia caledonica TaxID=134536 RepID=A0AB73I7S5_9BURK|nr:transcriptional regulator with XRE-family HTH domain [Paraburkholderia caledonica]